MLDSFHVFCSIDELSILFDAVFFVIVDWSRNLLLADTFRLLLSERLQDLVVKDLIYGDSFVGVENEHLFEEVRVALAEVFEQQGWLGVGGDLHLFEEGVGHL